MISRQAEEKVTTEELYTALSACANLHPDATSEPDDTLDNDDGTPPHHPHPAIRFEGDDNNDISGIYPLNNSYTESEGGGGASALPPPMPGSGGWITAENVGEFFDEEGNWRGGEEWTEREVVGVPGGGLGAGAGNVRGREEGGGGGGGGGVDEGDEGDETKWRRTE